MLTVINSTSFSLAICSAGDKEEPSELMDKLDKLIASTKTPIVVVHSKTKPRDSSIDLIVS